MAACCEKGGLTLNCKCSLFSLEIQTVKLKMDAVLLFESSCVGKEYFRALKHVAVGLH